MSSYDVINNAIDEAFANVDKLVELGLFTEGARAIGMIGATLYIFTRLWSPIAHNKEIDFFPLFRPFVLLVAITSSSVISTTLKVVYEDLNLVSGVDVELKASRLRLDQAIEQREIVYREYVRLQNQNDLVDAFGNILSPFGYAQFGWEVLTYGTDSGQEFLVKAFVWFSDGIGVLGYFIITIFSNFFIRMLSLVAPLAFAFAVFDGFTQNALHWFAKYINTLLLLSICKVYTIFTFYLQLPFIENSLQMAVGQTTLYVLVMLLSLLGYFFIPEMASATLSVGGVGRSLMMAGAKTIAMKNLATNTMTAPLRLLKR